MVSASQVEVPHGGMDEQASNYFLYAPRPEYLMFGRDDLADRVVQDKALFSPVDIAQKLFKCQYKKGDGLWILNATRHLGSRKFQHFKCMSGLPICMTAIAMLKHYRAYAWNSDMVDESIEIGSQLFQESVARNGNLLRRQILAEVLERVSVDERTYSMHVRGVAVWGRIASTEDTVLDINRGVEAFFKDCDTGVLQVPGEFEVAIWFEDGKYYMFDPYPADPMGNRVGLREGGFAYLIAFTELSRLAKLFVANLPPHVRRKPYSISEVTVTEEEENPPPVYHYQGVAPDRWMVRGTSHQNSPKFSEETRGKQAQATALMAVAMANFQDPSTWTSATIDEVLERGDELYQQTVTTRGELGLNIDSLTITDVVTRFKVSDYDWADCEVDDNLFNGEVAAPVLESSLQNALTLLLQEHNSGAVEARGQIYAVWKRDGLYYLLDVYPCDENGNRTDAGGSACVIRTTREASELAALIEARLSPGADDQFSVSAIRAPVTRTMDKRMAPGPKVLNSQFIMNRSNTCAMLRAPPGVHAGGGRPAMRVRGEPWGAKLSLPAALVFAAASVAVPPIAMTIDHLYNIIDASADYYLKFLKESNQSKMDMTDLWSEVVLGANAVTLKPQKEVSAPLLAPIGAEDTEEEVENFASLIKEHLAVPNCIAIVKGDYHTLAVWSGENGAIAAFDPAPCDKEGGIVEVRLDQGDERRKNREAEELADEEMVGEELEGEELKGEESSESIKVVKSVPADAAACLAVFGSPEDFVEHLVSVGGLSSKQASYPYSLYVLDVNNTVKPELDGERVEMVEEELGKEVGEEGEPSDNMFSVASKQFTRISRSLYVMRGRVAQDEAYFMLHPNRNHQDSAGAALGAAADVLQPCLRWSPALLDALVRYGDRLYTVSIQHARAPPILEPHEIVKEFFVTNFKVILDIEPVTVTGDITASEDQSDVLSLKKGVKKFFDEGGQHCIIRAKDYACGAWIVGPSFALWDPHGVGPAGRGSSPAGAAALALHDSLDGMADAFLENVRNRTTGHNRFVISRVKAEWSPKDAPTILEETRYEERVLTAFVQIGRGRARIETPPMPECNISVHTSCIAACACAASLIQRPALWTRYTLRSLAAAAEKLHEESEQERGCALDGEELEPLQVVDRFIFGVNYVYFELEPVLSGVLEPTNPKELGLKYALSRLLDSCARGIVWSGGAAAVWREGVEGSAPLCYMLQADTNLSVLRLLTFTSPELLAHAYLESVPSLERSRREFVLYRARVEIRPIKDRGEKPLVKKQKTCSTVRPLSATSKVDVDGKLRKVDEKQRKRPIKFSTCEEIDRKNDDNKKSKPKGCMGEGGWWLADNGSRYLCASRSIAHCRYSRASRGCQGLAVCIAAVAKAACLPICRWKSVDLDALVDAGEQLYKDSYLHYRPDSPYLSLEQVLRKVYWGSGVSRVRVLQARHTEGSLRARLESFTSDERAGVLSVLATPHAVAIFACDDGFYMFDPRDCNKYGCNMGPQCFGRGRACLMYFPNLDIMANRFEANTPCDTVTVIEETETGPEEVTVEVPLPMQINAVEVVSLS